MMLGAIIASSTIDSYISSSAQKYNVEPALIRAHIKAESNWSPSASRYEPHLNDYSFGLMQVLLRTAREQSGNAKLTTEQLLDPQTNIDIGTKYVAYQLKRYKGNIKDAISAYNAGSAKKVAVDTYSNQAYVDKVHRYYTLYKIEQSVKQSASLLVPVLGLFVLGFIYFKFKKS